MKLRQIKKCSKRAVRNMVYGAMANGFYRYRYTRRADYIHIVQISVICDSPYIRQDFLLDDSHISYALLRKLIKQNNTKLGGARKVEEWQQDGDRVIEVVPRCLAMKN